MMIKPQDDSKEMEKRPEVSAKSTGHEKCLTSEFMGQI